MAAGPLHGAPVRRGHAIYFIAGYACGAGVSGRFGLKFRSAGRSAIPAQVSANHLFMLIGRQPEVVVKHQPPQARSYP